MAVISQPPLKTTFDADITDENGKVIGKRIHTAWAEWVKSAHNILVSESQSGTTANRPPQKYIGQGYFDTTLGYKIWFDGTNWVDATGSTV